jgi:hypothetical protein
MGFFLLLKIVSTDISLGGIMIRKALKMVEDELVQ